jgi:hypothetical protein
MTRPSAQMHPVEQAALVLLERVLSHSTPTVQASFGLRDSDYDLDPEVGRFVLRVDGRAVVWVNLSGLEPPL